MRDLLSFSYKNIFSFSIFFLFPKGRRCFFVHQFGLISCPFVIIWCFQRDTSVGLRSFVVLQTHFPQNDYYKTGRDQQHKNYLIEFNFSAKCKKGVRNGPCFSNRYHFVNLDIFHFKKVEAPDNIIYFHNALRKLIANDSGDLLESVWLEV